MKDKCHRLKDGWVRKVAYKSHCYRMSKQFKKDLEDAKCYFSYGLKLGYWEAEKIKYMTDKEIIDFANYQDAKANMWAEQIIENGVDF